MSDANKIEVFDYTKALESRYRSGGVEGHAGPEVADALTTGKGSLRREPIGCTALIGRTGPNDGSASGRAATSRNQARPAPVSAFFERITPDSIAFAACVCALLALVWFGCIDWLPNGVTR